MSIYLPFLLIFFLISCNHRDSEIKHKLFSAIHDDWQFLSTDIQMSKIIRSKELGLFSDRLFVAKAEIHLIYGIKLTDFELDNISFNDEQIQIILPAVECLVFDMSFDKTQEIELYHDIGFTWSKHSNEEKERIYQKAEENIRNELKENYPFKLKAEADIKRSLNLILGSLTTKQIAIEFDKEKQTIEN